MEIHPKFDALITPRERQVLLLLADGKTNREIGEALSVSPRTVEVYRGRLALKARARNGIELIRAAVSGEPGNAARHRSL